jgi:hypothetical protein
MNTARAPRCRLRPDGDFTQTGVRWNQAGYGPPDCTRLITAPQRSGLYYLWAKTPSRREFSYPLGGGAGESPGQDRAARLDEYLERV